jgi:aspartyl-tRNA(Asn)/glutamyl-tRNA(Gln) amidotransferase subunit A
MAGLDVRAAVRGSEGDGFRVGVVKEAMGAGLSPWVRAGVARACGAVEAAGGAVVEVSLPRLELGIDAYYIVAPVEAASNLARFDGVRYGRRAALGEGDGLTELYERSRSEGFGEEVQRRIVLGTWAASAGYYERYYGRAMKVRRLIKDEVEGLFRGVDAVDALLLPTASGPAFELGAKLDDPLSMYLEDLYTVVANLVGGCAVSVPSGWAELEGGLRLPVGVQVMGPWGWDERVLRVAWRVEGGLAGG